MRVRLIAAGAVALGACAAPGPAPDARYWPVSACADAAFERVQFEGPDGGPALAVIPRDSCRALRASADKMQEAAGYKLARVLLVNSMQVNAFASRDSSGEPVAVVTLGMLQALGNDSDAWAGLLGHEIAHHVKHHAEASAATQRTANVSGQVVSNVIAYAVPGVGGALGGAVAGGMTQTVVLGAYSRPQESEADALALKWLVAARYDPRGMLRLFDALGKQPSAMPAFLSTHPANDERRKAVERFIAEAAKESASAQ